MLFIGIVLFIAAVLACQRDFNTPKRHTHRPPIKKRNVDWPPVLDSDEESIIVNSFDNVTVDEWSYYYGHQNKLAGYGREAAEWTRERWSENGFDSHLSEYHVYLSYPVSQSVKVTYEDGHTEDIKIQEDALPEDDVTGREDSLPTFHGYSASGHVTGEYVYVGLGSIAEYERLQELGVEVEGKIALVKYGGLFRGLKVKNAQDHGMIGVIIFTDPDGDGEYTVANGYEHYPDGPARHPDSVQKGSVLFLSTRPGDPTTPGYASHEDVPRASVEDVVPKIPSLPISYAAALPILKALDGYGTAAEEVNRTGWVGALEAEYATGPAPGVTISLENIMEERITPIWNVIGTINGTNSDETIVVGNHRDTWMIGGNGDPNSGSAILVELSKVLKKLTDSGWKPKRNIVFASWDGEEYGMLGSTEWVEDHAEWLTETAVAYLNIDVAVSGPNPSLGVTPELKNIGTEIMKKVIHPAGGAFNETLFDAWYRLTEGEVDTLGSGSDYTSFLHYGINSLDVGSGGASGDPVWHYHSNYDTYHWMSTYGDPGFSYHATMGQYLGLLLYHLSSDEVLPIDVVSYGSELEGLYDDLVEFLEGYDADLDLDELKDAVGTFKSSASEAKTLEMLAVESQNEELIQVVNHKYRDFQRGFVSQGGLPDREFYKHVVTAPGLDTGYAPVTYPGITEGVQYGDGNYTVAQEWVSKTARGIVRAAEILKT